jgi:asparagine synthase (glutamine-hydrolysing)
MCSFLFTNKKVTDVGHANFYQKFRGPDNTNIVEDTENGFTFVHNLLSITGDRTNQPFSKDNVVCMFNGEIYNHLDFGDYKTDGECLIDLYLEFGDSFTTKLDGEFAIVLFDYKKSKLLLSTDVFATKPMWVSFMNNTFGVSSYHSALNRLDFSQIKKIEANTTEVYSFNNFNLINKFNIKKFDLNQHKQSYQDWILAFEKSIQKRTKNTKEKIYIGLSSGYDSGAIARELSIQNVTFKAFSIIGKENENIIKNRCSLLKDTEIIRLDDKQYHETKSFLSKYCEDYNHNNYRVLDDKACQGLGYISSLAQKENYKIYFSGQGADEIISDYGWGGSKIYPHSQFGGLFPNNLKELFPWKSFYNGTQTDYINKEECVAGCYGMETRYPFLDVELVQEFLWLTADLKNKSYKSCLKEYLSFKNFPFDENAKCGFNPLSTSYQPIKLRS